MKIGIVKTYSSTSEFSDVLTAAKVQEAWEDADVTKRNLDKDFFGVKTFKEGMSRLGSGDAETAAKITAAGEIVAGIGGGSPQLRTAPVGCLPCVPNYLRGLPNSMYQLNRRPEDHPVIDVYVQSGANCQYSAEQVAEAARKIASAVCMAEQEGVRVNLFACICFKTSYQTKKTTQAHMAVVKIKSADEPLNLLNVAFPLAHPAFLRVAGFRWQDCFLPECISGRGYSLEPSELKDVFTEAGFEGCILSTQETLDKRLKVDDIAARLNEEIEKQK